jgi:methylmalonyl-CoA epimerase
VFQVTDLKVVSIATEDLDASVKTFRKNFGFSVTRSATNAGKTRSLSLGIGAAEIEMATPAGDGSPLASFLAERGPGLHQLVLEVDDLDAARAELSVRGIEVSMRTAADGKPVGLLSAAQTHGVRITLVGR